MQSSKYETVDTCLRLGCQSRNQCVQKEGTFYTSVNARVHSISARMDYVDKGRYGELKAPSNIINDIRAATHALMNVLEHDQSIDSLVIFGIHEHAILAYYVSSCTQTLIACKHWKTCAYPGVLCITFGLPKLWHTVHCAFEHWKVVMLDDGYVISPFSINLRTSPNTFWIGEVSPLYLVLNTVMSIFACPHSPRNIVHYAHAWSRRKPGLTHTYERDATFDILIDPSSSTL
jgi:hypothetical protein